MSRERIALWRWAKPSRMFFPTKNTYFEGKQFKSHNDVVRAGLNPIDWMDMMSGEGIVLHKIVLDRRQAELCVVAEACFRPTEEEITELGERMHPLPIGSKRRYNIENYERSFVHLLEYPGGYNLPEVLVPFSVKAKTVSCATMFILKWRLRIWFARKMKSYNRGYFSQRLLR